jgi:hypothetical protein
MQVANYRSDMPEDLPGRLAYVQAEAAAYRAKLMAQREASPVHPSRGPLPCEVRMFGVLPDAHLARLEAEAADLAYVIENRARAGVAL